MIAIATLILPVFLLILLGWGLRRWHMPGDAFWQPAERLTYFLLFPALIVTALAEADFGDLAVAPMAAALALPIVVMTLLLVAARSCFRVDDSAFTSLYQGAVRMNTYIGLSVAVGVHGSQGLQAAALAVAVIVPLVNVSCVIILAWYGSNEKTSLAKVSQQFFKNPLIIACALGGLLNVSGLGLPPLAGTTLEMLARGALPIGLLTVGAALDFSTTRRVWPVVLQSSLLKLVVLPMLTWTLLALLKVEGVAAFVAVLFNALPTAPTSYILARQMGGDAQLMASMITVQTSFAAVSLPLVLALLS